MASTAVEYDLQHLTCKCLNVRLKTAPTESTPPESSNDAEFSRIHVGEHDIQVMHPQLTLRVKSRGETIPGTTRCSRFTTLTCLVCDLAVYRVHQIISSEVEARELPLLPSDDWVEQEIMKSPSGWIEVHKECLSGEAVMQRASSEDFSTVFSLVLPPTPGKTPTSLTAWISPESTTSSTPTPSDSYVSSKLPPLLPPSPFTPSHPAFLHILSVAEQNSQSIRTAADQELAKLVRAKAAEVEEMEAELRSQIERLWLRYRQGLDKAQQDRPYASTSSALWSSPARTNDHLSNAVKAPVAIPGFTPVSATVFARVTPPSPHKSGLAQSLATNLHLHQAMADKSSHAAERSEGNSICSESPTLVPNSAHDREITSVLQFRRRVDDTINTAASYRYFLNVEEEMARHKTERASEAGTDHDETMGIIGPPEPTDHNSHRSATTSSGANTDGDSKGKEKERDRKESKNKSKHVHFNVQPMNNEPRESASGKSHGSRKPDSNEMVFQIDDDVAGEVQEEVQASLPLLDPPAAHQRTRRPKPQNAAGLPASFLALRPASLPAPSHMRSGRPPNHEAYSNNIMLTLPRPLALGSKPTNGENKDKEDTTDQDTSEDTTDSSPRPTSDSDTESEEDEGGHHHGYGIPGSLPINIVSSIRPREVLSLASYQSKSAVERQQQVAGTAPAGGVMQHKVTSASAIRKAIYAERDRARFLDPGTLDFVAEADEEDEEQRQEGENKKPVPQSAESGDRGRNYALRILQARAELPEEGMWRSLAS